jgi:hypothetical protein
MSALGISIPRLHQALGAHLCVVMDTRSLHIQYGHGRCGVRSSGMNNNTKQNGIIHRVRNLRLTYAFRCVYAHTTKKKGQSLNNVELAPSEYVGYCTGVRTARGTCMIISPFLIASVATSPIWFSVARAVTLFRPVPLISARSTKSLSALPVPLAGTVACWHLALAESRRFRGLWAELTGALVTPPSGQC